MEIQNETELDLVGIDQREEGIAMLIDKKKNYVIQFLFPQIVRKVKKPLRIEQVSFISYFSINKTNFNGTLPNVLKHL